MGQHEWNIDKTRWYMAHFDDEDEGVSVIIEVLKTLVVLAFGVFVVMVVL